MALEQEYQYFTEHLDEWLETHRDHYVLISGADIRFFEDQGDALAYAGEHYRPGTFLLQPVIPEEQDTLRYHSRMAPV